MTRKEALYKIKSILDNLSGVCSNKLQAEAILGELERIGMQPPKTHKLKKYKVNHKGENGLFESIENVNEWEE